jgi:PAS domain S-box-containing protein
MSRKTKTQVEAELRIAQAKIAQLERALHDARPNLQEHSTSGDDSQQKERLRQLFEILPVGISVLDDERRIVFHNSALSRILEITAEGLQAGAYNNRKYLSADGSLMPMDESASARTIRSGEPTYNLETGIIKENGETIWTSVSTVPVDFPDWKTVLVTADITERKRTEKKLQESQRNFQLFVEYSPAAIAMFDRDMRYIAASRRYIADYHLPTSDVIGRSHYEIFPEIPERWKEIHRRCLAGAIETAEADPFPRLDGRLDWVRWEIHPWYESDGTISGIILFSEVITNRIELEQERAKLTERLDLATRSSGMNGCMRSTGCSPVNLAVPMKPGCMAFIRKTGKAAMPPPHQL